MAKFLVQKAASLRLDEIYRYSRSKWGDKKAAAYIEGMFDTFSNIAQSKAFSRPIPSEFGINGFYCQYEKHFIYWKTLDDGQVGIVTILHQRMHQLKQFEHMLLDTGN